MAAVLLSLAAVAEIASRRSCVMQGADDLHCVIARRDTGGTIHVVAAAPGLWRAFDILRTCTELNAGTVPDFAAPESLRPLYDFEPEVAKLMAAAGVQPYWRGERTFPLRMVLETLRDPRVPFADDQRIRTSLSALVDAGLASVQFGPRGGWARALVTWSERACPTENGDAGQPLTADEDNALHQLSTYWR